MANIDCTLDELKVPGFSGYIPPFGKKVTGSVTPRDNNNNVMMPFGLQRPKVVTETSTTTQIQANIVFEFATGGITLTLGAASFTGCQVSAINSTNMDCTVNTGVISISIKAHESVHFEWRNGIWEADFPEFVDMIAYALDLGGRAHQEIKKTLDQRIQTGIATIINRGVISGLTVEKSKTAFRSISLNAGKFFMNGMSYFCPAYPNAALIQDNNGAAIQYYYVYIYFDTDSVIKFACTPPDGAVPENGMGLCRLSVPPGNGYQNDPYLDAITITDIRRVESAYPAQFNSIAYASVALPFTMLDAEYGVQLEIVDYKGGYNQLTTIHVANKAANGFNIFSEGTLDAIRVRWTALKQKL